MQKPVAALIGLLLAGAAALAFGPELWNQLAPTAELPVPTENNGVGKPVASTIAAAPMLTGTFTLAISWQPAFCEQQSLKPECADQKAGDFAADHFTLHGLWPEPQGNEYCGVSGRDEQADKRGDWRNLPHLDLPAETRARLETVMPGTASYLQRHEWTKHGTCSGADPDTYFQAAMALLDSINASEVRDLFAGQLGETLAANDIRAAFDKAFGSGSGSRVTVECGNDASRRLIDELRISIRGEVASKPDILELLSNAAPRQRGCPQGIVDQVGLQ
ncbi:MAG: ribonuclease [Hyphomicrobiaceae bacterium]|nr:ribonuclease [Hyphomicrobiaceae bacterium]MCC0023044.1 ribonuclease [Hyphomicrobiaceae bacterium]